MQRSAVHSTDLRETRSGTVYIQPTNQLVRKEPMELSADGY